MPQLDKVTLFSQVFWFILLYFFFFIIFINYCLPQFSKLFKIRLVFLEKRLTVHSSRFLHLIENIHLVLVQVLFKFNEILPYLIQSYQSKLLVLALTSFKQANVNFVKTYLSRIFGLDISHKVYF